MFSVRRSPFAVCCPPFAKIRPSSSICLVQLAGVCVCLLKDVRFKFARLLCCLLWPLVRSFPKKGKNEMSVWQLPSEQKEALSLAISSPSVVKGAMALKIVPKEVASAQAFA